MSIHWPWRKDPAYPARVEFECKTPLDDDTIARHVEHALSLDLPEADAEPLPTLRIIANGPSALQAPLDGPTLALNGAMGLFFNSGRTPTYWAACDPQEKVADFLPDAPPTDTVYYVASKCHPAVFEKLNHRDVRLWHPSDHPVPGKRQVRHATTITLTAPSLFRRLGWRKFEFWGWDACILDGRHHAIEQGDLPDQIEATVNGRSFKTRQSWALETKEAGFILQILDAEVDIKGDGMIAAYWKALNG